MAKYIDYHLRDVLTPVADVVSVNSSHSYMMAGVYSFGKGLFIRGPLEGSQTTYKYLHRLHENQFVISQPKGWEGALARVSSSFDGYYLSPVFPTFQADSKKLNIRFLEWYCKQALVWEQLRRLSKGLGARRESISSDQFLSMPISLPPLDQQEQIANLLDAMAANVEEIRSLCIRNQQRLSDLVISQHLSISQDRVVRMGDMLELFEEREPIRPDKEYPQIGIRGFGKGMFYRETISGTDTTYKDFNRLFPEAVVLSQVKGWEGAIAVCPPGLDKMYASPEYRTFRCKPDQAIPGYLAALFPTAWFLEKIKNVTRGIGARRQRIRPEMFLEMKLPMPPYEQQEEAVTLFEKLAPLQSLQIDDLEKLDKLIPVVLEKVFRVEINEENKILQGNSK